MDSCGSGGTPSDVAGGQLDWKTSMLCTSGNCVEVAHTDSQVYVRDNKHTDQEPLTFTHDEWRTFVGAVRAGEFDLP